MSSTRMKSLDYDTMQLTRSLMTVPREHFVLTVKEQPQQASADPSAAAKGNSPSRTSRARHPRWPVEPPPVVEINLTNPFNRRSEDWLVINSPNCFCIAEVLDARTNEIKNDIAGLSGATVSSIYKVKDSNYTTVEHGYFVFPDLWIRQEGAYRLRFTLFEMNMHPTGPHATKICFIDSKPFHVMIRTQELRPSPAKSQTYKDLQEAGLKIKMRKRINKRAKLQDDWSASLSNVVFDAAVQRMDDGHGGRIRGTNLGGSLARQPRSQHGSIDAGLPLPAGSAAYPGYAATDNTVMRCSHMYSSSNPSPDDVSPFMQMSAYPSLQSVSQGLAPGYNMPPITPPTTLAQQQGGLDMSYMTSMSDGHIRNGHQQYQQLYDGDSSHADMQGTYAHSYPIPQDFTTQAQGFSTGI